MPFQPWRTCLTRFGRLSLLLAGLTCIPMTAAADNDQAVATPVLRLATREYLPPYIYEKAESGIEIDLIKTIMRQAGYHVEFVQLPRIRMIQVFDDGKLDGILTQNQKTSTVGCATQAYIDHQNVAFTLTSRNLTLETIEDLSRYAIISFSGATRYLGPDFAAAVTQSPRYTESGEQGTHISLLYKHRFDVVVGDEWIIRLAQKRYMDHTGLYQPLTSHAIMPVSRYVARFQSQVVCDAFNKAYEKLNTIGTLADIWTRYQARILVDAAPTR